MNKKIFNKKTNDVVLTCWLIIAFVVLFTYILKCLKGEIGYIYVILYSLISFIPIISIYHINKSRKESDLNIKFYVALGYILFYTFIMVTSKDNLAFVYIMPMIATLVVYSDRLLIGVMSFYAVFINFACIIIKYLLGYNSDYYMNVYSIEVVSIFLFGIFLFKATEILKMGNDKLYELSETINKDPLTEAYNRKFVNDNIEDFISDSDHDGLSFAILDIDDFKKFNTKYGHDFGDIVLKTFSAIIIKILDKYHDMYFIRLGGDEFAIIAVDTDYKKFIKLIENIRYVVENYKLNNNGEEVSISISLGATNSKVAKSKNFEKLYKKADLNLYKAKEKGKNTVVK